MEKGKSATKGFAMLTVAGIINKILSVLYVPILLQIITDLGYGIYSAGYRIYAFIYILTNSGFPIGISKLQAELIAHENYRDARRSFKLIRLIMTSYGLIMALVTAIFAGQITHAIQYDSSYYVILALSPTMLFSAMSSTYRGFFNGSSDMKPTAMSQVIEQLLNVILSLGFALVLKPYGLVWACAGATVGTTIGSLGSVLYLRSKYKHAKVRLNRRTPADVKRLEGKVLVSMFLSYAIPIAINSIVVFGGDLIDLLNTKSRLIAAGFTSEQAYIKFGVLTKYTSLLNVPLAITTALYVAMMPSFSASVALKDYRRLRAHINNAFRMSLFISIPAAAGLSVLSKPIFMMLFSQRYIEGWQLMAAGSIVVILYSVIQIQAGVLQSINKTKYSTYSMLAGIGVKVFLNYFLIAMPALNVMGAVIGTIASFIVALWMNSIYIRKFLPIDVAIKKYIGRPFVASAAMSAAAAIIYKLVCLILRFIHSAYAVNGIATVAAVLAGVFVYGIIMLKIKGITSEDLDILPYSGKLKKLIPPSLLEP